LLGGIEVAGREGRFLVCPCFFFKKILKNQKSKFRNPKITNPHVLSVLMAKSGIKSSRLRRERSKNYQNPANRPKKNANILKKTKTPKT